MGGGVPTVSFRVDGSDQVTYTPVPMSGQAQYNQQFYSSPLFRDGQHTIVVTMNKDSSPLYLDYFAFESLPSTTTSPIPVPSSTSSQPSSASGTTNSSSPSSTGPSTSQSASSASHASSGHTVSSAKAGAIVGACLGGLISIVLVTVLLLRRRYRRPRSSESCSPSRWRLIIPHRF